MSTSSKTWTKISEVQFDFFREGKYEFITVNGDPSFYNILMKLRIQVDKRF